MFFLVLLSFLHSIDLNDFIQERFDPNHPFQSACISGVTLGTNFSEFLQNRPLA